VRGTSPLTEGQWQSLSSRTAIHRGPGPARPTIDGGCGNGRNRHHEVPTVVPGVPDDTLHVLGEHASIDTLRLVPSFRVFEGNRWLPSMIFVIRRWHATERNVGTTGTAGGKMVPPPQSTATLAAPTPSATTEVRAEPEATRFLG